MPKPPSDDQMLTPAQVAHLFGVDSKTVSRWAAAGRLPFIRTMGGHRRYSRAEMLALIAANRSRPAH